MEAKNISPSQLTSEGFTQLYSHTCSYLLGTVIYWLSHIIIFFSLFIPMLGGKLMLKIIKGAYNFITFGPSSNYTELHTLLFQLSRTQKVSLIVTFLIFIIIHYALKPGYYRFLLTLHDTGKQNFMLMFSGYRQLLSFSLASIMYLTIVTIGLSFLIFPGIYWAIRFSYYPYIILEKETNARNSLKESYALTNHKFFEIFKTRMLAWVKSLVFIIRSMIMSVVVLIPLTATLFSILMFYTIFYVVKTEVSGLVPLLAFVIVGAIVAPLLLWLVWLCSLTYRQLVQIKIYQLLK